MFKILKQEDLLVKRRKKAPRTTNSRHYYAVQPNLFNNKNWTTPGQAVVADITYLRISSGFGYLFLVTDACSKNIVGWELSSTMEHKGAIKALERLKDWYKNPQGLIHHSDRGSQYCCHEFLREIERQGIKSSMTDADHCAQNALAERMNGILKDEFYLDLEFQSFNQARRAVENAILIYNTRRPHRSLKMKKPIDVHFQDHDMAA